MICVMLVTEWAAAETMICVMHAPLESTLVITRVSAALLESTLQLKVITLKTHFKLHVFCRACDFARALCAYARIIQ